MLLNLRQTLGWSNFKALKPQFISFSFLTDFLTGVTLARGYKAALRPRYELAWSPFTDEALLYIKSFRNAARGSYLHMTRRRTPFLGFALAIETIESVYEDYVKSEQSLQHLLTYKMSQDHLCDPKWPGGQ